MNTEEKDKAFAYLEKQKEQKPTDEQFPPLEGLDAIKAKYYDDGFKNGFDEGVESVKPAEWSEEEERMLRTIISDGSRGVELDSKQIQWLKSLRPQPHWKPSEEWMEKQGVSYNATISADKTIPVLPMKDVSNMGLDYGDRVIVQIRKK